MRSVFLSCWAGGRCPLPEAFHTGFRSGRRRFLPGRLPRRLWLFLPLHLLPHHVIDEIPTFTA